MEYKVSFITDFLRNNSSGLYIAIEGIDGSGKTTQAKLLTDFFKEKKHPVVFTHEPTRKGLIGKLIHSVLQAKMNIPSVALQYLFCADRAVHQEQVIVPSLEEGKIVVSDRCFWSAIAYGIADRKSENVANTAEIFTVAQSVLSMYHQFMLPDITFFMDIPLNAAIHRLGDMNKGKEIYEKSDMLHRIKKGYDWMLKEFPKEFVMINGTKSVEEIQIEIRKLVGEKLK